MMLPTPDRFCCQLSSLTGDVSPNRLQHRQHVDVVAPLPRHTEAIRHTAEQVQEQVGNRPVISADAIKPVQQIDFRLLGYFRAQHGALIINDHREGIAI